jgi:two-component system chemotaxis response regulator CheB
MVRHLPSQIDAAFFVVLHLPSKGISNYLIKQLQPHTSLTVGIARHKDAIESNHIYIAPPDSHLLVTKNGIAIGKGAKENRSRPSIDVLFRSMAAAYNTRAIGIILSGLLDDGTLGMQAIKRSGGTCIVQDPDEAEFPDMPLSVLKNMEINFSVRLSEIGNTVASLAQLYPSEIDAPPDVIAEAKIAERQATGIDKVKTLGQQSVFTCPDCGGALWQITNGKISEYRCHVGHSFSEGHLKIRKRETLETTLYTALRILEERKNIFIQAKEQNLENELQSSANENQKEIDLIEGQIYQLKEIVFSTGAD